MTDSHTTIIKTPRLQLRPIRPVEDTHDFLKWFALDSVRKYTGHATPTEAGATSYLTERAGPTNFNFAVCLAPKPDENSQGKIIGLLGSKFFPWVGYMFDPHFGGKGYATEALQAFIAVLFEKMPSTLDAETTEDIDGATQAFDYAVAHVDVDNAPSVRLLERCGWTRGEFTEAAYTSAQLGIRPDYTYRIARPGLKLEDVLAAVKKLEEGEQPVPDLK